MKTKPIVIGGADPSGGAGIQADLFTLNHLGFQAQSVITALTAQNEKEFFSYESVSPKIFSQQLQCIESKNNPVKIAMLGHDSLIEILIQWLPESKVSFVILDPVLRSSTGAWLLNPPGIQKLPKLFPWIDLLTPNIPEAENMTGLKIKNTRDMQKAGNLLLEMGARNILLKGGHLAGNPCDILMNSEMDYFFEGSRLGTHNTHGTGCTLASAILAYFISGNDLVKSVQLAREIVRKKIETF